MRYTKLAADAFSKLQLNAGLIVKNFDPETGTVSDADILFATSEGSAFEATPSFSDFGEDIDNCPANTMELKKLDYYEVLLSGTAVTMDTDSAKMLVGAADVSGNKVTPRADLLPEDFNELWWVGDYSDDNTDENGGFIAIKMINALSTGGFKLQSNNKGKGQFEYEFMGHYSMTDVSIVPFEIYIKEGGAAA